METILILFVFVGLGAFGLAATEIRNRKRAALEPEQPESTPVADEGCCGAHLVCERETLLQTNAQIEYYDDEELDALAGIAPEDYTDEQHDEIEEIFISLQSKDVPGWCRSLQLRNIQLPLDIREQCLMIVQERRKL